MCEVTECHCVISHSKWWPGNKLIQSWILLFHCLWPGNRFLARWNIVTHLSQHRFLCMEWSCEVFRTISVRVDILYCHNCCSVLKLECGTLAITTSVDLKNGIHTILIDSSLTYEAHCISQDGGILTICILLCFCCNDETVGAYFLVWFESKWGGPGDQGYGRA